MANSYGNHLTLHIFGGSHDAEIGMTLEGFPKGVRLPEAELLAFMARRAPGQGPWATSRKEPDIPVFTAGVTEEMTEDGAKVFRDYLNNWYDAYVYDLPVRAVHEVPEMNFEKRPRILLLSTCYGAPHGTDRLPLICVLESEYYLEK